MASKAMKAAPEEVDWGTILDKAKNRAARGGIAGSAAMFLQVGSLMWMRTTMNYQYRYGTGTITAIKTLYAEGGIPRFYAGVSAALFQGPLSRFGDTAANEGVKAILEVKAPTMNPMLKTVFASVGAASWRIVLMPIDACKTIMQVEGKGALGKLGQKVKVGGPQVLWHGALGACGATFVGHYPWFATYNTLDEMVPTYHGEKWKRLGRNALLGLCASVVSDTCSNSVRVCKTFKQTSTKPITYPEVIRTVIAKEGLGGLFGRGLTTRWAANGLQGALFSVLFKGFKDKFDAMFEGEK